MIKNTKTSGTKKILPDQSTYDAYTNLMYNFSQPSLLTPILLCMKYKTTGFGIFLKFFFLSCSFFLTPKFSVFISDCELVALLDDDTGMELLVFNKIISLDLPVKQVYKKIWCAQPNVRHVTCLVR